MSLQNKTIMLIDDDAVLRVLVKRVLTTVGCEVISCGSVKEAMLQFKTALPDLVILDLNMPEFDGLAFLKLRRDNPLISSIPVLVLSGTKDEEEVEKAMKLGAEQFLEKPFEARLILQKLKYIFYSKVEQSYQFPADHTLAVEAEINANLVGQAPMKLKVESLVKLFPGKPVILTSDNFESEGGAPLVCRVDPSPVELKDGLFGTHLTATGLGTETKKQFEAWQRHLLK